MRLRSVSVVAALLALSPHLRCEAQSEPAATTEAAPAATNELAKAKQEIESLKKEVKALKSADVAASNQIAKITAGIDKASQIQIARPGRIPEDVRYLSDLIKHEKIRVSNGMVTRCDRFFLRCWFDCLFGTCPAGCDAEAKPLTIEEKLVELRMLSEPSLSAGEAHAAGARENVAQLYRHHGVEDWNFHRLRYGVATYYNDNLGGVGAGLALRGYPAYSRYMDGRLNNWEDLVWRRLSVIASVGGMLSRDDAKADSTGMAFTAGVGWDICYGISLFAGESFYTYSKPGVDGNISEHDTVFGITLNSEFWKTLFGQ